MTKLPNEMLSDSDEKTGNLQSEVSFLSGELQQKRRVIETSEKFGDISSLDHAACFGVSGFRHTLRPLIVKPRAVLLRHNACRRTVSRR